MRVALAEARRHRKHQRTPRDEVVPSRTMSAAQVGLAQEAFSGAHRVRRGRERVGWVVAEEFELAADQRVHGAV